MLSISACVKLTIEKFGRETDEERSMTEWLVVTAIVPGTMSAGRVWVTV
ncbi:hypothetical protein SAMN05216377_11277 [Pseudonocardia oroxyli]|uniref:Uncharacterized protein n=1 Tax=Pseudonocardia oroxyli TaxID=366584 RepID=A0A1G7UL90_PSEOR|nr:hypothetical protein SAMN05216377_11277 [Pseudonocardia oroxyli]